MKKTLLSVVLLMFSCFSMAQSYIEAKKDSVKTKCVVADKDISCHKYGHDKDNAVSDSLILNEVVVKSSRVVNTNGTLRIFLQINKRKFFNGLWFVVKVSFTTYFC